MTEHRFTSYAAAANHKFGPASREYGWGWHWTFQRVGTDQSSGDDLFAVYAARDCRYGGTERRRNVAGYVSSNEICSPPPPSGVDAEEKAKNWWARDEADYVAWEQRMADLDAEKEAKARARDDADFE